MRDYYLRILGLTATASEAEIKIAYKNLVKKYHPDVNKSSTATSDFQSIMEAYNWLITPQQESEYAETEYEQKKHEYLQRRYEKERAEKELQLKRKTKIYFYIRPCSYVTLLFGIVMILDALLPVTRSEEKLVVKYQYVEGRTRHSYSQNSTYVYNWVTTESDFKVPEEAYYDFVEGKEIIVSETVIFKQTKQIDYFKNNEQYYFYIKNVYSYLMIIPILVILCSTYPLMYREYTEGRMKAAYCAAGFCLIAILLMIY